MALGLKIASTRAPKRMITRMLLAPLVLLLCNFALSAAAPPPPPSLPSISVQSSQFTDSYGRQRFFHGINNVNKAFPWIDPVFQNASYAPYLKSIGVNVVRLGWMWSGFEPAEGAYNMTCVMLSQHF